jgi:hypothetical protein
MRSLLLLMLAACDYGASTKVVGGSDTGSATGDTGGAGSDDTGAGGGGDLHPSDVDDDSDGYTENEGDCDDADEDVHPGVEDRCDGIDSDCDGTVDEDASDEDLYEPNDAVDFDIGELESGDVFEADAFLHDAADIDRFHFSFNDGTWDFFTLEIDLEWGIDDVLYVMTVENVDSGEIIDNQFSTAGTRSMHFEFGDSFGTADGGNYRVTISSDGSATCLNGYQLTVALSGLF